MSRSRFRRKNICDQPKIGAVSPQSRKTRDRGYRKLFPKSEREKRKKNTLSQDLPQHLLHQLERDIAQGRSTPGSPSANDLEDITLWKCGRDSTEETGK